MTLRKSHTHKPESERRVHQPYGLEGGSPGSCGQNLWIKQRRKTDGDWKEDGENLPRIINLGGKSTVKMGKNDHIRILTPGAGGWGREGDERRADSKGKIHHGQPRGSHADRQSEAQASA